MAMWEENSVLKKGQIQIFNFMDLFKDIKKSGNDKLKKEAKHELSELGGEKKAEAYEKKVKKSKKEALEKKKKGGRE